MLVMFPTDSIIASDWPKGPIPRGLSNWQSPAQLEFLAQAKVKKPTVFVHINPTVIGSTKCYFSKWSFVPAQSDSVICVPGLTHLQAAYVLWVSPAVYVYHEPCLRSRQNLYGPACHSIINVMLIVLVVTKHEFLARCVTVSSGCIYSESSTTHSSHDSQLLGSHPVVPYQAAPEKQSWTRYINSVSSLCLCTRPSLRTRFAV